MTGSDWLLALHLLGATALVSAIVLFTALIVASANVDRPSTALALFRISRLGDVLIAVGATTVLVFGVWLALELDAYSIFDGWVLASLALWAVSVELGRRSGKPYYAARDLARQLAAQGDAPSPELRAALRSSTGLWLHVGTSAAVVLILILMIFKPGA